MQRRYPHNQQGSLLKNKPLLLLFVCGLVSVWGLLTFAKSDLPENKNSPFLPHSHIRLPDIRDNPQVPPVIPAVPPPPPPPPPTKEPEQQPPPPPPTKEPEEPPAPPDEEPEKPREPENKLVEPLPPEEIPPAPRELLNGKPDLEAKTAEERQNAVRNMMVHAWTGYVKKAWGADEVRPVSGNRYEWLGQGATIVDSLDTLWIMGLKDEFKAARDWVASSLHFNQNKDVSVFETVIRVVGGLLSAYDLSRDPIFLRKAEECAQALLPAYSTGSGVPYTTINFKTGRLSTPSWNGGAGILAEAGTIQLEFVFLSRHTNVSIYETTAMHILDVLKRAPKTIEGLYPIFISTDTGRFTSNLVTLGAMGDSFYEYLVKLWAMLGGNKHPTQETRKLRSMYDTSTDAIIKHLVQKSTPGGLTYLADLDYGSLNHKMDHLACFAGGMFSLGATYQNDSLPEGNHRSREHMDLAAGITRTCHEMYDRMASGVAPEFIHFSPGHDFSSGAHHYLLRPEAVEAMLYMWRLTHNEMYREWGWKAFCALERRCRSEFGYSGLHDVRRETPGKDNAMPSYFLAETIKYLYLLFSPDSLIPLNRYVFNTEAHPLSILA